MPISSMGDIVVYACAATPQPAGCHLRSEAAVDEALLGQGGHDELAPETRLRITALMAGCSFESTAHQRAIDEACAAPLVLGTCVYVTALPGDAPDAMIAAAVRLRKAGL